MSFPKIEIKREDRLKKLYKAYDLALNLANKFESLGEPILQAKARKLYKICWYNIERIHRET